MIHSRVVLTFVSDDAGNVVGYYVVSDYDSMKRLYYCSMDGWMKLLRLVADDDVVSTSMLWDFEREEWITTKSRKLPVDGDADLLPTQIGEGSDGLKE